MGVGVRCQGVNPPSPGDSLTLLRIGQVMPDQLGRVPRVSIPGTVLTIARKTFDAVDVTAEIEAAAAEDFPHPVRGREALMVLFRN